MGRRAAGGWGRDRGSAYSRIGPAYNQIKPTTKPNSPTTQLYQLRCPAAATCQALMHSITAVRSPSPARLHASLAPVRARAGMPHAMGWHCDSASRVQFLYGRTMCHHGTKRQRSSTLRTLRQLWPHRCGCVQMVAAHRSGELVSFAAHKFDPTEHATARRHVRMLARCQSCERERHVGLGALSCGEREAVAGRSAC